MNLDSAIFYSKDIEKVIPFYRDIIGLKLEYQQGEKYVSFLFANGVRLGIKKYAEEREVPGTQTIFIGIDDINRIYEDLKSKAEIYKDLQEHSWGKEFSILDSDGNKVMFIQRK